MPVLEPGSSAADRARRRRGKGRTGGPPPQPGAAPPQPDTDIAPPAQFDRIGRVWRVTQGTIPTGLAYEAAGISDSRERIERAARLLARDVDISPRFLFGKSALSDYREASDVPIKATTLQRITDNFALPAIASMLKNVSKGTPAKDVQMQLRREGRGGVERVEAVNPMNVAKHARALTRTLRDRDLDAQTVMGIAALLERRGINPKAFEQNLSRLGEWARQTNQDVDWQGLITVAEEATQNRRRFQTNLDVVSYLAGPKVEEQIKRGRRAAGNVSVRLAQPTPEGELAGSIHEQAMLMAVTPNKDFFKEAKALESEIVMEQTAFQRSWLGKAVGTIAKPFDWVYEKGQEAFIEASSAIIGGGLAISAGIQGEYDLDAAYKDYQFVRHTRHTRLNNGENLGSQLAKDTGAPAWVGVGADFALAWYLDPFVLGGKALKFARAGRVHPGLLRPSVRLSDAAQRLIPGGAARVEARLARENAKGLDKFYRKWTQWAQGPESHNLLKLAKRGESGDTARYLAKIDDIRNNYNAARPLNLQYMKLLRDTIRKRFPDKAWNHPEVIAAWDEAVAAAGGPGLKPLPGSVGDEAGKLMMGQGAQVRDDLAKQLDDLPEGAGAEARELIEAMTVDPFALPMSLEVPASGIARFGPRRALRRAATSPLVQSTGLGRRAARLGVYHPPRWLNYHANPEHTAYEMSRYFRMPEQEARVWESKVLEASVGPGFEDHIDTVFDELTEAGIRRVAAPYNIDPVFLDEFVAANLDPIRDMRQSLQAFGVENVTTEAGSGLNVVSRPLFESQRKNFSFLVDPIEVETRLQQIIGAPKRMEQAFRRAVSKTGLADVPEIGLDFARLQSWPVKAQEKVREIARSYLRLWKGGTVARPAYISRVVLLDEQLRFLSTTGSLFERLLAQRGTAKLAGKTGLFERNLQIGDEAINLPLPGERAYEPLAANSTRQAEVIAEMARRGGEDYAALTTGQGWDLVEYAKNPKLHLASWHRALVRDIANSPHGIFALELIAKNTSLDDTVAALITYAQKRPNFARLQRNGIVSGVDDIDRWARQTAQTTHAYTLAGTKHQARIARAAMHQPEGLEKVLKQVQRHAPPVHGPMVSDVMLGQAGIKVQSGIVDMAYNAFVRLPEDVLNRQPFYRVWKTRAEEAYMINFQDAVRRDPALARLQKTGVEAPLWPKRTSDFGAAEQLEAVISANADQYFYHQTRANPADMADGLTPKPPPGGRKWETAKLTSERNLEPRVYLSNHPDFTNFLTAEDFQGPMLRVRKDAVKTEQGAFAVGQGTEAVPVEFFTTKGIPSSKIEFFGSDGMWHPLRDAAKTINKPLTGEIRKAIDIASRDFALAQVKKIMFDFTRQSRFTELLQIAVPFPQPFFEGFQSWGHLAVRNPAIIGRARALFELGKDTGMFFKDPNGEWTVKNGMWAAVARKLSILDPQIAKSLSFTAPLTSFNMLASTSVELPENGILGKMVGGVNVPVPSLHPPLMNVLQRMFAKNPSETITGYLFQFGPGSPFIPKTVRTVINAISSQFGDGPALLNDERLKAATGEILKQYQAQPALIEGMTEEEVTAAATEDAYDLIVSQDLIGLLSPGALRARFGHDEVEDEFNRRVEEDPTAAYDWLRKTHPDLSLIGMGKTLFTGSYKDAEGKPVRAPREISSEFFGRLVTQPGFRQFARNHPEWLALLVVGIGREAREFDFSTFSRQVNAGVLSYKRPEEYWAAGEDSKGWNKWYEWRRDHWVPMFESLPEEVEEDDPAYTALKRQRSLFLTHVAVEHPGWARRHLVQADDGSWDFGYDPSGGPASVIEVLTDARAIVDTKGWEKHPGVKSLKTYLDGRDDLEERMRAAGTRNVYDSPEFSAAYDKLKAEAVQMVPEEDRNTMETFFDSYFENDLTNIRGYQDRQLERLRKRNPELADNVVKYDTKLEVLSMKAQEDFEAGWERSARYQDVRNYQERIWKNDPKVVRNWWKLMKPGEQEEYKEGLVTRPSVFWSSHDWEVMGVKLTKRASAAMNEMAEARIEIQRRENADPTYSESEGYEAIDTAIRNFRGKDKTFDQAVKHMSDWAYTLEAAGVADRPTTGRVWKMVIEGVREVQGVADRLGWQGVDYGEEVDRKNYASVQDQFQTWIEEWQRKVPAFEEEWNTIKKALGGSVIEDLLIPDNYFGRLGDVD
jgi:hypothetical protein